ncbi:MAG: hypothetical protein LN415_02085 [Candidatus Thermoplasmatota archaeon]|nr:hypothetical protein [Candidatus Thermoplasmatota archaeon]
MVKGSPELSTRKAGAEMNASEDSPSREGPTRQLGTRVGILNGENVFEAIDRDARRAEQKSSRANDKALVLGIAFYGLAIVSLVLLDGKHILAFFFAAMGIFLTALGDFLRRRTSVRR